MNRLKREEAKRKYGPSGKIPGSYQQCLYQQCFEHALIMGNMSLAQELLKAGVVYSPPEVMPYIGLINNLTSIFESALRNDDEILTLWILNHPGVRLGSLYKSYCLVKSLADGVPRNRSWHLLANRVNLDVLVSANCANPLSLPDAISWLVSNNCEAAARYLVMLLLKTPKLVKYHLTTHFSSLVESAARRNMLGVARGLAKLGENNLSTVSASAVKDARPEIIVMLYKRGWRPTRAKSPRILDALAEKLEQAGYPAEAQNLRDRTHKIVAHRLAKELER